MDTNAESWAQHMARDAVEPIHGFGIIGNVLSTVVATALPLALILGLFVALAPASSASSDIGSIRSAVIRLTNDARAKAGCKKLKANSHLTKSAQGHAQDMAKRHYFEHDSKSGKSWDSRIASAGYRGPSMGENIAYGQRSAREVVRAWMNSPSHRHNILTCEFDSIGVGWTAKGPYWVQDFGGS